MTHRWTIVKTWKNVEAKTAEQALQRALGRPDMTDVREEVEKQEQDSFERPATVPEALLGLQQQIDQLRRQIEAIHSRVSTYRGDQNFASFQLGRLLALVDDLLPEIASEDYQTIRDGDLLDPPDKYDPPHTLAGGSPRATLRQIANALADFVEGRYR